MLSRRGIGIGLLLTTLLSQPNSLIFAIFSSGLLYKVLNTEQLKWKLSTKLSTIVLTENNLNFLNNLAEHLPRRIATCIILTPRSSRSTSK